MIELGSTSFVIHVSSLPRDELETYSTQLFDDWDVRVAAELDLSDYALFLEVEEGSLRGRTRMLATAGVLAAAVATYDGFFSGIQRIQSQVRLVADFVAERAAAPFPAQRRRPTVRRHRGVLGRLEELFVAVQRGELTAEQAMRKAEELFGAEAQQSPEFMRRLDEALRSVPLHPEQLPLPMALPTEIESEVDEEPEKRPSAPRPKPVAPLPQLFRVEIWRESKKSKRGVKVIEL